MRNFVAMCSVVVLALIACNKSLGHNIEANTIISNPYKLDYVFSKLKDLDKETLIIFNCESILFSHMDAAFSKTNNDLWSDFYKKRINLSREKDLKIDRSLFFVSKRIIGMNYKQDFKKIQDRGTNIVFIHKINENRTKFSSELSGDIRGFTEYCLRESGFNINDSEKLKDPLSAENNDHYVDFKNNLLITNSKNISDDIAKIIANFSKNKPLKKIIIVHDGSWDIDKFKSNIPMEKILVSSEMPKSDITKDEITLQQKVLFETGEWLSDFHIKKLRDRSDEEIIYEICKQSIMDVCPCQEIKEKEIYTKIESIVKDKNVLKNLKEIIDCFQEIYSKLPSIFHYTNRVYLWDAHYSLGIKDQEAIEMLKKIKKFYFNEYEVKEVPYKVLKRLGCGIHWRDMAKYEYIKNFLVTGKKEFKENDSSRHKLYLKVLNIVFDRLSRDIKPILDQSKTEFIKILIDHEIENKKIMKVFNISEEKLKNIISEKALEERTMAKKIEKIKKN